MYHILQDHICVCTGRTTFLMLFKSSETETGSTLIFKSNKYMKIYHKNAWTCYLTVSTEGLKILMKNLGSVLENQLNTVSYCLRDIIIRDSERYHCHFYLLPCPILRFDKLEYHSAKISLCVHCRRTPLGWESTVYFLHVNRLKQPARVVQPNTLLLVSWLTKSHLT